MGKRSLPMPISHCNKGRLANCLHYLFTSPSCNFKNNLIIYEPILPELRISLGKGKTGEAQVIEDWVEQCQNGHTRAYTMIVTTFQEKIIEFLFRMTQNRELAEDLGQEVFLRAYRLLDRYDRNKAAFSTWLFTLARNLCLDELRKKRPFCVQWEESAFTECSPDPDPNSLLQDTELEELIARAVASLDPIFREVFILRDYQDLSFEEVAEITGIPVGTVKSRLHRARLLLQEKLAPALSA